MYIYIYIYIYIYTVDMESIQTPYLWPCDISFISFLINLQTFLHFCFFLSRWGSAWTLMRNKMNFLYFSKWLQWNKEWRGLNTVSARGLSAFTLWPLNDLLKGLTSPWSITYWGHFHMLDTEPLLCPYEIKRFPHRRSFPLPMRVSWVYYRVIKRLAKAHIYPRGWHRSICAWCRAMRRNSRKEPRK